MLVSPSFKWSGGFLCSPFPRFLGWQANIHSESPSWHTPPVHCVELSQPLFISTDAIPTDIDTDTHIIHAHVSYRADIPRTSVCSAQMTAHTSRAHIERYYIRTPVHLPGARLRCAPSSRTRKNTHTHVKGARTCARPKPSSTQCRRWLCVD